MVFKKMLGASGVGGPTVDTVLADPNTQPGGTRTGQVNLTAAPTTSTSNTSPTLGLVAGPRLNEGRRAPGAALLPGD
ncbi:hypothetical protein KRM28CT15_46540 [Krasilnikovia sp. M28-CT-15]